MIVTVTNRFGIVKTELEDKDVDKYIRETIKRHMALLKDHGRYLSLVKKARSLKAEEKKKGYLWESEKAKLRKIEMELQAIDKSKIPFLKVTFN